MISMIKVRRKPTPAHTCWILSLSLSDPWIFHGPHLFPVRFLSLPVVNFDADAARLRRAEPVQSGPSPLRLMSLCATRISRIILLAKLRNNSGRQTGWDFGAILLHEYRKYHTSKRPVRVIKLKISPNRWLLILQKSRWKAHLWCGSAI